MISLQNITVKRNSIVLDGINLAIKKGERVGIIGSSGEGKSTLLQTLAGLLQPDHGDVIYAGKKLPGPKHTLIPGHTEIQLVDQQFKLELFHTVRENIKEKVLNLHASDRDGLVQELLDVVELNHAHDRQARYLSGGEQQRLAIARALVSEPDLLLLDEPFVHLDHRLKLKLQKYIRSFMEKMEMTCVLVSHDGEELMGFADRIIHLSEGRIVRDCSASAMFYDPQSKAQAELMGFINVVRIQGKEVLFRPNEYRMVSAGLKLKDNKAVCTGLVWYNYFRDSEDGEIVLTSTDPLPTECSIEIKKREVW